MDYQIRLKGHLDPQLVAWMGAFHLIHTPEGETLLEGALPDQAALHGVLARCRDLGVTILSINPLSISNDH